MIRIRRVYDDPLSPDRQAMAQVRRIPGEHFPQLHEGAPPPVKAARKKAAEGSPGARLSRTKAP